MKMAKPSERDIDAAGDLLSLLMQIDRGDYPNLAESDDVPDWFDEDDPKHLRAFYDAVKATLDKGPGYPGRVIGGMCYVIMWDKNEIVDPESDTIDLHPKIVKALEAAEAGAQNATAQQIANVILHLIGNCVMDWKAGPTGDPEEDAFHSDDEERATLVRLVNQALAAGAQNAEAIRNQAADTLSACRGYVQYRLDEGMRTRDPIVIEAAEGVLELIGQSIRDLQTGSANTLNGGEHE